MGDFGPSLSGGPAGAVVYAIRPPVAFWMVGVADRRVSAHP